MSAVSGLVPELRIVVPASSSEWKARESAFVREKRAREKFVALSVSPVARRETIKIQ